MSNIQFVPAGTLALDSLAELFTRSFEGYLMPVTLLPEQLAQRIRVEHIDLWRSLVVVADNQPAGLALVALRGTQAWCGGFGIATPWRGQGLAAPLARQMLEEARAGGATQFTLEVLAKNERAARVYQRAGLQITRDLLILEWRQPEGQQPETGPELVPITLADVASHFYDLHQAPAAWQRDLPALLGRGNAQGLALWEGDRLLAYGLYQELPGDGARLLDLGTRTAEAGARLAQRFKQRYTRVLSVNEPADNPGTIGLLKAGLIEIDRQHEMMIAL
jgi:ribosomal protein S18 acetylase RimI-like enzyme